MSTNGIETTKTPQVQEDNTHDSDSSSLSRNKSTSQEDEKNRLAKSNNESSSSLCAGFSAIARETPVDEMDRTTQKQPVEDKSVSPNLKEVIDLVEVEPKKALASRKEGESNDSTKPPLKFPCSGSKDPDEAVIQSDIFSPINGDDAIDPDLRKVTSGNTETVVNDDENEIQDRGEDVEMEIEDDSESNGSQMSYDFCSDSDEEDGDTVVVDDQVSTISRNLDVEFIRRSIESSAPVLQKVKGKDVVLVVGDTGTGKSTLIQALSGKKLFATKHTTNKFSQVADKVVFEADDPIEGFEIGHAKTSKTRHINCCTISFSNKKGKVCERIFVDTPGFGDTAGLENDLATAIMLAEVARQCHRLSFVILVNYVSLLEKRGGAIISVLKMVRNFVDDFEQNKRSFMFLFTHTNEIREIPDGDIKAAEKALLKELVRTADCPWDGDDEVQKVLKYMCKSLKKSFPFCSVFHPLHSNVEEMLANVSQLTWTTGEHLASKCGFLTPAAKAKLEGEVQKVSQALRRILFQDGTPEIEPNLEQAKRIYETLITFENHIALEKVQEAAQNSKQLLSSYIRRMKALLLDAVKRGTMQSSSFGQADILNVKHAMKNLGELSTHFEAEADFQSMNASLQNQIACFQKTVVVNMRATAVGLHSKLTVLKTWADGFAELMPLYTEVKRNLEGAIDDAISGVDGFQKTMSIELADAEQLRNQLTFLGYLEEIRVDSKYFADHVDVTKAICLLKLALAAHVATLNSWPALFEEELGRAIQVESEINRFVARARAVEVLYGILKEATTFSKLRDTTASVRDRLAGIAQACMFDACTETVKDISSADPKLLENRFRVLSNARQAYHTVGPKWDAALSEYFSAIQVVKSHLKCKSGELEEVVKSARDRGVVDGRRDACLLSTFASFRFFDHYLQDGEQFIQNCFIAYSKEYLDRTKILMEKAKHGLQEAHSEGRSAVQTLKSLKSITEEMEELSHLSDVLVGSNVAVIHASLTERLGLFVKELEENTRSAVSSWEDAIQRKDSSARYNVRSLTERIGVALEKVAVLRELRFVGKEELNRIENVIGGAASRFSSETTAVMMQATGYQAKADRLYLLAEMAETSRVRFRNMLPGFVKARESVKRGIATHAEQIEARLLETSEWDEIDELIQNLEEATIFDVFTEGEASSRLRLLRKLREKKEEQVDEALLQLIADENYDDLCEFLTPLAHSRDQIKRQKFHTCLSKISSSLSIILGEIRRQLGSPCFGTEAMKAIVAGLEKLERADEKLGKYISADRTGLNLKRELRELRRMINSKFDDVINKLTKAGNDCDFVVLGECRAQLIDFQSQLSSRLFQNSRNRSRVALEGVRKTIKTVSFEMESFVDSKFETEGLLPILTSLKDAAEQQNADAELTALFDEIVKRLTDEINRVLVTCREMVLKSRCFDDAIGLLSSLDGQLRKGLEDFVTSSDLVAAVRDQIRAWCEERLENEKALFVGTATLETIRSWKKELDGLDPKTLKGYFQSWVPWKSYSDRRKKMALVAEDKHKSGLGALKARDFALVQECISTLDLIAEHLHAHIPCTAKLAKELKREVSNVFKQFCGKAKKILTANGARRQFQEVFDDYRKLIVTVPSVMLLEESRRDYSLINQLTYEALDRDLSDLVEWRKSLDFPRLKKNIENLRRFGNYVADYFILFREEVRRKEHLEEDCWLSNVFEFCQENFSCGRDFRHIGLHLMLGTPPSATKKVIKKAFRSLAKIYHPDKQNGVVAGDDQGAMFRKIKEASEKLEEVAPLEDTTENAFDELIRSVHKELQHDMRTLLDNQRYDEAETVLSQLRKLHVLDQLVTPSLNSNEVIGSISSVVKSHVDRIRIEVETNWDERKYQELNENIGDLRLMESHFKNFPNIFSQSWNTGIIGQVENEIDRLGKKARKYLVNKKTAKASVKEFRRCFIKMGFVLVELAPFKGHAKSVMSDVLEDCLRFDWGYSYLFDFGLSLQRADESSNDEENLVAHVILGEFNHFKEVLTMVWNEETSQKPAEDTIKDIRGHDRSSRGNRAIEINTVVLMDSLRDFEGEYKSLLGEYMDSEADFDKLIQKVSAAANSLKPLRCDKGWSRQSKQHIPFILAGVFAVFTIRKSQSSYNRIGTVDSSVAEKLLMKPHSIQVLTLLCMFGCASAVSDSLESQLLQIRTGEGKSIILGAAAAVLGLLGFRVRCVCYSEYLSTRDYGLFKDVFDCFCLGDAIKYSKITSLSEDTTAAKGDIRNLTTKLLLGKLDEHVETGTDPRLSDKEERKKGHRRSSSRLIASRSKRRRKEAEASLMETTLPLFHDEDTKCDKEEILLVDEVDVFFGSEFYGRTYNQVATINEPEVRDILQQVWDANKRGGRRLRLADVQQTIPYKQLLQKLPWCKFLVDSEVAAMLSQVRLVDEEPYYLDRVSDRIGYKVMDCISYDITFGYRTTFAYMREAENGNISSQRVLSKAMGMQVSCGQFSYANISPARILGVSGTLDVMGEHETNVLSKYGVSKYLFVPSVYGQSNSQFDKGGDGIKVDSTKSDYFQSITDEIRQATKKKRAVIVFFRDKKRMDEYTSSTFYPKLGRQKKILLETMSTSERDFVIQKAATSGQITLSTAVFGRGTDFFCKDDRVQKQGGVHVIQAFLSEEHSEEIQIQGRTARQGKKGSYQMILLESDLASDFGVGVGSISNVAKSDLYAFLCQARNDQHQKRCQEIESNLLEATKSDRITHAYFDSLLAGNSQRAQQKFYDLYQSFKKKQMPSTLSIEIAFLVDITGSMAPFTPSVRDTIKGLISGPKSIDAKLKGKFPEIQFSFRFAALGYRDIDDKLSQYQQSVWSENRPFTEDAGEIISLIETMLQSPSGGGDIAEDHLGAMNRASSWQAQSWTSDIKFMMMFTDAPAHGMSSHSLVNSSHADRYPTAHPQGLKPADVVGNLIKQEIDFVFCSFNPVATLGTEEQLSHHFLHHELNTSQHEMIRIPMVAQPTETAVISSRNKNTGHAGSHGKHIVFVLDESGSMSHHWSGVVNAYNQYLHRRRQNQNDCDLVSVVQFDSTARTTVNLKSISSSPASLTYSGGGTCFHPAAEAASGLVRQTPSTHVPLVVFMSDGCADDSTAAAGTFSCVNRHVRGEYENRNLELHVIGFGGGTDTQQLQQIAHSTGNGKVYTSANTSELSNIFVSIAGGQDVAGVLEAEVGKRITEAVVDRLAGEYLG